MRSNDDSDRPVHSLLSSFHDLRGLPLRRLSSTVPCRMIFSWIGENCCWLRHGNQLPQKQTSRHRHPAKGIYQHMERMNGETLEEVDQFKYLESTKAKDGTSVKEVKIRLAQAHLAMTRLPILWRNKVTSFPTKIILCKSLVLPILLFGRENVYATMASLTYCL